MRAHAPTRRGMLRRRRRRRRRGASRRAAAGGERRAQRQACFSAVHRCATGGERRNLGAPSRRQDPVAVKGAPGRSSVRPRCRSVANRGARRQLERTVGEEKALSRWQWAAGEGKGRWRTCHTARIDPHPRRMRGSCIALCAGKKYPVLKVVRVERASVPAPAPL